MIELPEAVNYAKQLNRTIRHKKIKQTVAAQSPHKFAWYHGDPQRYAELLVGKAVDEAYNFGGVIEFRAGEAFMAVSEGTFWRYHEDTSSLPKKHQMLIVFEDDSALTLTVRMYGGILCFKEGEAENEYYLVAKEKTSPLSDAFDRAYFDGLIEPEEMGKLSMKAFLATEQRIPGLGNGCLQDILFNAKLHPKRKVVSLNEGEKDVLFQAVKDTLAQMVREGGRDTEPDLFGQPGGYATKCSKNTVGQPCAVCGTPIQKASYMGGSIYFCPTCQPLD